MEPEPAYQVQLQTSCRLVGGRPKFGISWVVMRRIGDRAMDILLASPDVFDDEDDAKRDAVQKLEPLVCCRDSPLSMAFRTTIDWMVDESE